MNFRCKTIILMALLFCVGVLIGYLIPKENGSLYNNATKNEETIDSLEIPVSSILKEITIKEMTLYSNEDYDVEVNFDFQSNMEFYKRLCPTLSTKYPIKIDGEIVYYDVNGNQKTLSMKTADNISSMELSSNENLLIKFKFIGATDVDINWIEEHFDYCNVIFKLKRGEFDEAHHISSLLNSNNIYIEN